MFITRRGITFDVSPRFRNGAHRFTVYAHIPETGTIRFVGAFRSLTNAIAAVIRVSAATLAIVIGATLAIGCANTPTAPTVADDPIANTLHDVPATLPDGTVVFVCTTQPRSYIIDDRVTWERDHYITLDRCPAVPIP